MEHQHFLIYKPYKMVSQFISNDKHQRKKRFLGELYDFPSSSMAVGRLDETTEGLLLITTNGKISHEINNSESMDKEYFAQVDGDIDEDAILRLKNGITISIEGTNYETKRCEVKKIEIPKLLAQTTQKIRDARHGPTSWVSITLKEGKFRQVRKMTSAAGFPTLRLIRHRIGPYTRINMNSGDVIKIEDKELRKIIF